MSDETEVEQLLESFQKALDTLNQIGNVEALITKLDANKNRKLLKRVKHVVSEVHSKVGTVKEKVSRAYKKVKIRSSSESEDFATTNNIDKNASDREDLRDKNNDVLVNIDDYGRYSPVLGRKGKSLKQSERRTNKSQKQDKGNNSVQSADDVGDQQSEKDLEENNVIPMEGKETDLEENEEGVDNTSKPEKTTNCENTENQVNADDIDDQTEETTVDENKEKGSEGESSQDIIESTPEKTASKISLSLNKTKNINKDNKNNSPLDPSSEEKIKNSTKDKTEKTKKIPKGSNKSDQKEKEIEENKDDKEEETSCERETSQNSGSKQDKNADKENNLSDSEEVKEVGETAEKSLGEKDKKKNKKSDMYDDEEDKLKEVSRKSSRKDKNKNETKCSKIFDDEEDKLKDGTKSKDKNKAKHSNLSDNEEDKLKDASKKSSSKKNKNSKEKAKDALGSDKSDQIERTAVPDENDKPSDDVKNKRGQSKKANRKLRKLDNTDSEKDESDSEIDSYENSSSKKDKAGTDEVKNISDSDENDKTKKTSNKPIDKKNKDGRKDSVFSDEEDKSKDTPKKSRSKRDKHSKRRLKPRNSSESDYIEDTTKKSSEDPDKHSDEEEEKNKQNGADVINENDIVTIEGTPKKGNSESNDENDSSDGETVTNENEIVTIEDTPKKGNSETNDENDSSDSETAEPDIDNPVKIENEDNDHPPLPKIKLVDISKLLAPNTKPLDIMTPSPKTKKSVTFDSSVIILSSSDEETPKKVPKSKDQSPLKSAMRKASKGDDDDDDSDSDSKENNENLKNRRSTRRNKTGNKVLTSDHDQSSEDSDFEQIRKSRRLRKHEIELKDKFSKLASKYSDRKSRAATRRLRGDDEDLNKRRKKRDNKDKKLNSDSDDNLENDNTSKRNRKRRRKKELLETSSLSENSDHSGSSDSGSEISSKKKSEQKSKTNVKKAKVTFAKADKNDPKFKADVFIRLPLFKCEELRDIYKKKKEIFEVKKLTNMDFVRRTRSTRNGSSKTSDGSDKPDKKRIKLTLKLNRKDKQKKESSDEERSGTEENKDETTDKGTEDTSKDKEDIPDLMDPFDSTDDAVAAEDPLAEACLEQINDNSDKEVSDKQSEKSDSDEEEAIKKKKKNKKNKENKENGSDKGAKDTETEGSDKGEDEVPKENGILSESDEQNDKNQKDGKKDKSDESSDENDGKKKKGKNWKNDKLLKEKIDSSDSDEDFAKYSKKKDKTNSELVRKTKKRMKKTGIISDSDSDEEQDTDKKKKKKKAKDSDDEEYKSEDKSSESESGSEKDDKNKESDEEEKKKPARKRIKRVKDSSSDDDDKSTRKHLRRMIDRDSLSETTIKAEQEEKARKARIADKQKKYNQIFELKADATVEKVVLDFDEATDKPLLSVSKKLVKQLKPHQVLGVKFMWDACFESLARLEKDKGSGCILAHCMGLGKTLQVIALVHTLLTNSDKTKVEKVLVVCPVNTVLNWKSEFKKWIPKGIEFEVYELVSCKTSSVNHERSYIVREWHENGGVLIIGYNMFRTLSNPENKTISKKLRQSFQEGLVDPGPDLVVCDEGHLLKNEKTNLSIAMNRIKTPRRIVLTGTPLQNNLKEYWCMVQFIKPNLLGTYKEYMNRFVNPITNGQYTDSTQHDIVVMRRRSHVLHKLLDGVVQRQDYSVLEPYLPPKYEYVLFVQLTEVQVKLYKHYMDNFARKSDGSNRTSFLFTDFQQLQRMCTHPRVLLDKSIEDREKKELNDESDSEGSLRNFIDDDESEAKSTSSDGGSNSKSDSDGSGKSDTNKKKKKTKGKRKRVTRAQAAQKRENSEESDSEVEVLEPKEWWQEYIDKEELDNINHSSKIFLLFEILKECEEIGDKVLVFSQSLYTLNCIEYFLQRIDEATQKGEPEKVGGHTGSWAIGLDYFRLDGSSSCDNRANWCDQFNDPDNTRARLFLISTKAGGLGINLVAANRVIIFDVSWNPSHDIQSIYRVYRFGQTKPSYIYRFVTYGAMEMKIYERQVTKQAISKRVIDEQQIDRHYSQNDIQELYKTDLEPTDRPIPLVPKDVLLGEMLQKYDKTVYKYHEHQSLLENKQDEELNEEERKAAWDEFENEKVVRKTTLTNFGGMNLAAFQNSMNFSPQLIQVALANIVRKDNPAWSEVQIRGILPALVTQLQMQMSENDFSMYNRVQQEIRLMQALQAQRMRENYIQQYQLQQMLQKQQMTNQMLGNLNISPEELRRLQSAASQNYINPAAVAQAGRNNLGGGGSGDVIELND